MTVDQAIVLMTELVKASLWIGGPVLGAALIGGVLIGILQTATQINEASLAYIVKAGCVLLVFFVAGTSLANKTVQYAREHFERIRTVVK